jgi:hypothetical protein
MKNKQIGSFVKKHSFEIVIAGLIMPVFLALLTKIAFSDYCIGAWIGALLMFVIWFMLFFINIKTPIN